jgi:2Fe-2S ferredoxin
MKKRAGPISFIVLPEMAVVHASHGQTVLQALLDEKIEIDHRCGGMGTCGTCRVYLQNMNSEIPSRNEIEMEMAQDRDFAINERLACQITPMNGLCIKKPVDQGRT